MPSPTPLADEPHAIPAAKAACRRRGRRAVAALDFAERSSRSLEVLARVLELPEYRAARHVLAYASLPDEVATGEILALALEAGRRISLPAAEGGRFVIAARLIRDPAADLVPGPWGVPVPLPGCAFAALAEVDLLLIPGRAFDRGGGRVGRGAGYYDRLLARPELRGRPAFGLAFDCQVFDEPVPRDGFDVNLAGLITEYDVIRA